MNPEASILSIDGCPLHYWYYPAADQSKPTVVFTHGAGIDHRMFDPQIPALQGKYPLLTWDVRGQGESRPMGAEFSVAKNVTDLLAILDHLGIQQAIFVGQSMGGNTAQEIVRFHPDRVIAMGLVDCVCNCSHLSLIERWAVKATPALLKLYPRETLLRQSAKAASIKPAVQQYIYEAMSVLATNELGFILQSTLACLRDEPDYRLPKPFILFRGDHDKAGAIAKQAAAWAAREPKCLRYVIIPDAGHNSNQDNPEFFNRELIKFLEEITAG